jgi:hypothetical protein
MWYRRGFLRNNRKSCDRSWIFVVVKFVEFLKTKKGARMASHGRELLGEHYNDEHLTYEEITELGLRVVTEKGEMIPTEELQGKIFRIADRDDASGYMVSPTESTGTAMVLCYLQAS